MHYTYMIEAAIVESRLGRHKHSKPSSGLKNIVSDVGGLRKDGPEPKSKTIDSDVGGQNRDGQCQKPRLGA